jgi:hypothetical protein
MHCLEDDACSIDGADVDSPSVDGDAIVPVLKRKRPCRTVPRVGDLSIFLLAGVRGGLHARHFPGDILPEIEDGVSRFCAVVLGRWEFHSVESALAIAHSGAQRLMTRVFGKRAHEVVGVVVYKCLEVVETNEYPEVIVGFDSQPGVVLMEQLNSVVCCRKSNNTFYAHAPLGDVVSRWETSFNHGRPLVACVASLCTDLALVLADGWPLFHIVALIPCCSHKRFILGGQPSTSILTKLTRGAPRVNTSSALVGVAAPRVALPRTVDGLSGVPADMIIDWLDATRFLQNIKDTPEATRAWDHLLNRLHGTDRPPLDVKLSIQYSTLRRARVRFDCICMAMFAVWFATSFPLDAGIHIWTDGSPQWRGVEMFASTFDVIAHSPSMHKRYLFPIIRISHSFLTATGKTFSVLWQIMPSR